MKRKQARKLLGAYEQTAHRGGKSSLQMRQSVFSGLILWFYRLLNCQRRWRIGRILMQVAVRLEGGQMQSTTARTIMHRFHGVEVGDYSYGPCFDPALIPPGVEIGRYVSLAPNVRLITQNHPMDRLSTHPFAYESKPGEAASADMGTGAKQIGHDVWIGYNAVLTPGCKAVGNGAVIGAGAVVTRDVPEFAIVAGNPAKVIGSRFDEAECERVRKLNWWTGDPKSAKQIQDVRIQLLTTESKSDCTDSTSEFPQVSVVIPAHNEGQVIERCLRKLLEHAEPNEVEVVVVANGCTDETVQRAKSFSGVRVLETSRPSKVDALNLGDRTANAYPRIYLDADVELDIYAVRDLVRELNRESILAAAPRITWDLTNSNFLVRAFYRIWRRQSYFSIGHVGSGVYAVSKEGHQRMSQFPNLTADDEYVRRLFSKSERGTAMNSTFTVAAPRTLKGLVSIKTRSRRGNLELDQKLQPAPEGSWQRNRVFVTSVMLRPQLWFSAAVYAWVVFRTQLKARASLANANQIWERDLTSRQASA